MGHHTKGRSFAAACASALLALQLFGTAAPTALAQTLMEPGQAEEATEPGG